MREFWIRGTSDQRGHGMRTLPVFDVVQPSTVDGACLFCGLIRREVYYWLKFILVRSILPREGG